jgi:hypothetical protein
VIFCIIQQPCHVGDLELDFDLSVGKEMELGDLAVGLVDIC